MSLFDNFLAIGCPGREDTWLHTGKVATDWEGEDVGAVYLYRRDTVESAFAFFQVRLEFVVTDHLSCLLQLSSKSLCYLGTETAAVPWGGIYFSVGLPPTLLKVLR